LPVETDDLEDIKVKTCYTGEILYDPTPKAVLNVLVPQYIVGAVFATLVQAVASEHCARMVAMNSANKNADKMLDELNLEYNRARQEKVTNELLEIVSTFNI
jgi:F-type H+-transporting ATPase subunit gamma